MTAEYTTVGFEYMCPYCHRVVRVDEDHICGQWPAYVFPYEFTMSISTCKGGEMDASELAKKMLEWESKKRELDALEAEIKDAVMALGNTQTVGNVRATYSAGRRTFDYQTPVNVEHVRAEAAGEDVRVNEVCAAIAHTSKTVIDWKAACEALGLEKMLEKEGAPSVALKLL